MSQPEEQIWSNTDYPYSCLIDKVRTDAFKVAIQKVVKPGDVVIDIGSGSGILSLFAAAAGAGKVYAVEMDPVLVHYLKETIAASPYKDIIELVEGDALDVDLPKDADVVIAELMETGMMDEMQVPVMNNLHARGVISEKTRLIPENYQTYIELVHVENDFYGHVIKAPMHNWPHYASAKDNWYQVNITPLTDKAQVSDINFLDSTIGFDIEKSVHFTFKNPDLEANALRISGVLTLTDGIVLQATNALNGDKIMNLPDGKEIKGPEVTLHVKYRISAGMGHFSAEVV